MSKERDFKGVWIPKHLWLNPDLSPIEKLFLAEIDSLDNDPKKGCFASNEYFGEFFQISEGRAANIISSLRKRGYIIQVFFDGRNRGIRLHENVKAGFTINGASIHDSVKPGFTKKGKPVSRKSEHNNTVEDQRFSNTGYSESSDADAPDVELPVEEEKKKKKDAPAHGSVTSWTKTAATIFDEVGAELSKAEGIDYIPFNWKVCNEQNFAHLKNLRKLAIEPDFKNKMGHLPNDEEFFASFRAVMTLSFKYFRKIQKETNGALHYTPTSIYSSYNKIKNFKNGNTNNNGSLGGQPSKFGQGGNQNGKYDPAKGY
jgi:hypothetical protein